MKNQDEKKHTAEKSHNASHSTKNTTSASKEKAHTAKTKVSEKSDTKKHSK